MSKVFAKYTVIGDEQDILAFETAIRHIDLCCMVGASREIKLIVDGDGSANLKVFRDNTNEKLDQSKWPGEESQLTFSREIHDDVFNGKRVEFGTMGVIEENGDGKYSCSRFIQFIKSFFVFFLNAN